VVPGRVSAIVAGRKTGQVQEGLIKTGVLRAERLVNMSKHKSMFL
jgi:hypothetical protein